MAELGRRAKAASRTLATAPTGAKDAALHAAADLLSDAEVAAALGRSGQRYVELTYRWEQVHARLEGLIAAASPAAAAGQP